MYLYQLIGVYKVKQELNASYSQRVTTQQYGGLIMKPLVENAIQLIAARVHCQSHQSESHHKSKNDRMASEITMRKKCRNVAALLALNS